MKNDFEDTYPISKKIARFAGEAINDYNMINNGDAIMIGISGGKDSLLLALALASLKKRSPIKFSLSACLIDQSGGSLDITHIREYMDTLGITLIHILHPTYEIMRKREERSPCSLCANLRRGILATCAKEHNANVIALGHHKDDAAETVLMNLFYGGRFKCFHPHLYMSRTGIRVIRPLVYVEEKNISAESVRLALPVVNSCCPYGKTSKRTDAKATVAALQKISPDFKSNLLHALTNITPDEGWRRGMQKDTM
ncbi:MAG: ATP-binding protein [Synergistes sp.]|nr:ATP-binding protein [Synergistes sp.]